MSLKIKIKDLPGPVLIIGASGFLGANLLRSFLNVRNDVTGTVYTGNSWRLNDVPVNNLTFLNLQDLTSVRSVFSKIKPKTVFDCSSFGAYSFEQDIEKIHSTNYLSLIRLLEELKDYDLKAYIHAGSSSEYGLNSSGPKEFEQLIPNSHYAVSKAAASQVIKFYGKTHSFPIVNLRLYSVYGPYEDSSRLIPTLCAKSFEEKLPTFANSNVTRDFIHVDDVIEAFIDSALNLNKETHGESFNIGTGIQTSLSELSTLAKNLFNIEESPVFNSSSGRLWDVDNWYADPDKAFKLFGWKAKISLRNGLESTQSWWKTYVSKANFSDLTKYKKIQKEKNSVSAIIACYKDVHAIPIMYQRLTNVFNKLSIDYEIIFVNDNSPDNTIEVIKEISSKDPHVMGINHSRNFGSQAAFRSGLEIASKESCVLLDGDLQDPPEIIETFVQKWREGADVVYGRRAKREMPFWLEVCYRTFYRIFSAMSEVSIPKDAGDFSLMDRSVVYWILQCEERDVFLRGLRAYVGFTQVGVDYTRPERMFGRSTNNIIKNIGWAKKGIFSFSRIPLHALTAFGGISCFGTIILGIVSIFIRLVSPESVPKGTTFISVLIMFFGSATILGVGLLGEYIGKIFEETKKRPAFIRRSFIVGGSEKSAELYKNQY